MTASQTRILREAQAFIRENSFSPTVGELGKRLGMSAQNVSEQLQRLERLGVIRRQPGKPRSLVILQSADTPVPQVLRLVPVPIIGTVAAGYPVLSAEHVIGEVLVEESVVRSGIHFALKADGRSMTGAGIQPNDIVIVRQQQLAENKDIVVVLLNGEATLKRLHYSTGAIELRPENSRFKSILIQPEDDLRILGKVVAIRRTATRS